MGFYEPLYKCAQKSTLFFTLFSFFCFLLVSALFFASSGPLGYPCGRVLPAHAFPPPQLPCFIPWKVWKRPWRITGPKRVWPGLPWGAWAALSMSFPPPRAATPCRKPYPWQKSPPPVKRVARDAGSKPALLGRASRR